MTIPGKEYLFGDLAEIDIQIGHQVDVVIDAGLVVGESTTVVEFSSDSVYARRISIGDPTTFESA